MKTYTRIWGLWPDIESMAEALNTSPAELRQQKDAGSLPAPQHDQAIKARSLWAGRPISDDDLKLARQIIVAWQERDHRRGIIHDLIVSLGGAAVVARHLGVTSNAVRIYTSRGTVTRTRKYEFMALCRAKNLTDQVPAWLFG